MTRMRTIQIRNVPDDVRRTLEERAAREGMSLSDYLLRDLVELASRPALEEIVEHVRRRPMVRSRASASQLIREARDERVRDLEDRT
jgi:plasmid stability protein